MTATIDAIYEDGHLRLLKAISLPEHTQVRVHLQTVGDDSERAEWLAQGERSLLKTWDNEADDVYNELLAP
jgi:predicted DNA-binding antitoxin AbrB/MazE fold protein